MKVTQEQVDKAEADYEAACDAAWFTAHTAAEADARAEVRLQKFKKLKREYENESNSRTS